MEQKLLGLSFKQLSAVTGAFSGILSVYGVTDSVNECVDRGAFSKSIQENGDQVPLLWQHKTDCPIGMLTLQDTPSALLVKGQLQMLLPDAQKAHILMASKIVNGLSIGFTTLEDSIDSRGVRHLKSVRLYEGSVVVFPALESAQITDVKAASERAIAERSTPGSKILAELQAFYLLEDLKSLLQR